MTLALSLLSTWSLLPVTPGARAGLGTPNSHSLGVFWAGPAQRRHNHLPQPPFLILIFLLASRFCILISPETRTVCESHDAAGKRSEYDVPRDLEQEIHKIPETSQSLQRLLTHHLHHPHLLLRCSHELLSHHEGNLF